MRSFVQIDGSQLLYFFPRRLTATQSSTPINSSDVGCPDSNNMFQYLFLIGVHEKEYGENCKIPTFIIPYVDVLGTRRCRDSAEAGSYG